MFFGLVLFFFCCREAKFSWPLFCPARNTFQAASPELGDRSIYQAQHFPCVASKRRSTVAAERLDVAKYCTLINDVAEVQQFILCAEGTKNEEEQDSNHRLFLCMETWVCPLQPVSITWWGEVENLLSDCTTDPRNSRELCVVIVNLPPLWDNGAPWGILVLHKEPCLGVGVWEQQMLMGDGDFLERSHCETLIANYNSCCNLDFNAFSK